ncbi:hypothetical protein QCE47_28675 [Caballeronia sp. LZ025]|uniref:hypothetical protein n=1 Tax=Caballeronia TaxID=1827195 RepID=UPI001FD3A31B|nr:MULTISPECIES: hypothetical protein [Caballeronia]MDR5736272.1 hypothetical protein [Caballeronia sp. LZ025]
MRKMILLSVIGLSLAVAPLVSNSIEEHSVDNESSRLVVDMGKNCVISVNDYFKGHFASEMQSNASYWTDRPPGRTSLTKFSVDFVCDNLVDKSKEDIARQYGATYDGEHGRWVPYYDSERDSSLLSAFTKVRDLKSVNGRGFYLTQDDRDGNPAQRERYLAFCIFHDSTAVCGSKPIMYLGDPKGSLLPFVLRILRSVEFVDTSLRN